MDIETPNFEAKTDIDRIVREPERRLITGRSSAQWWRDERSGKAPRRIKLGDNAVGWRLSELKSWLAALQTAPPRPVAVPAPGKRRGRRPSKTSGIEE